MALYSFTFDSATMINIKRKYLVSGVMVNGKYEDTSVGTPQGSNLSPLLSNIMLNKLDKELESKELPFVRYANDALIFVKSEKAANRAMCTRTQQNHKRFILISLFQNSRINQRLYKFKTVYFNTKTYMGVNCKAQYLFFRSGCCNFKT